ncbi:MAG: glycosyltransferase [Nanoarchaeota archaeon]|nr:glycosyltransferase [Nanoarchaeota archaeon]
MTIWSLYLLIYTLLAFGYLWYRYTFLLSSDPGVKGDYRGKVSVIIPFYNEEVGLLLRTVRSAYGCEGEKEIIVIDDGSTSKEGYNELLKLKKTIPFQLMRYEQNKGKRHAQVVGFKMAKGDIIVTLDSDTLLDKKAIINLIKPFSDEKVGATTGQLEILNRKKNFLTRLISARYWNAFNFERKSQSALGVIVCCTGSISAYRTSFIKNIIDKYQNQIFMGKKCTYGDDRHLTTLVLKANYTVKYVKDAIGFTFTPDTWRKFLKQQTRWKKSWLRETCLVSKFMFRKNGFLSFEILISTFITFFSIFARIGLLITLLLNPSYIFVAIVILTLMSILHSLYVLFNKPEYFFYSVIYGFIHAFVVYWTLPVAIATFTNIKWGTR